MYDLLLIASALFFIAVCIFYARLPAASLHHPATFYLAFHGFLFVLRPFLARHYEYDFVYRLYNFEPSMADKITVIVGANVAMATFVLVTLKIAPGAVVPVDAGGFARARRLMGKPILIVAALLTPLAIWSQIGNWGRRANAFDTMARDLATGTQINLEGTGWFTDAGLMLAPLAVLVVWLARYRWWSWPFFLGFAVLQAGTGIRGPLIYAILALVVLYLLEKRRAWPEWRSLVMLLVATIAFDQILLDRGGSVRTVFVEDSGSRFIAAQDLDPLEQMDFAMMEYFEFIVFAVPQRTGTYDYFAQNLQIFTEPIPRSLWRDKPIGSPVQFFSLWDYGRPVGITGSLPGVGWMSLGYAGIVIQAGFFAALFGWFYAALLVRRRSAPARLLYALLLATAIIVFRDGALLSFLRTLPFYLGPLLAVLLLARLFGMGQPAVAPALSQTEADALSPAERRRALSEKLG